MRIASPHNHAGAQKSTKHLFKRHGAGRRPVAGRSGRAVPVGDARLWSGLGASGWRGAKKGCGCGVRTIIYSAIIIKPLSERE